MRRLWKDSSDIGYSSDVEEDDRQRFEDRDEQFWHRTRTVAGGASTEDTFMSSQASPKENPISKFHQILSNAIMDGLDALDFSYFPLLIVIQLTVFLGVLG